METLKQEAMNAISKMPETADIDDIIYRLYVIDEVRKGREAIQPGKVITAEELREDLQSW
jgi:predicted transcriptional regulator